ILPQRFSTAVFSDMPVFPDFFSFFYGHVFLRLRNFVENFFTYPVNSNQERAKLDRYLQFLEDSGVAEILKKARHTEHPREGGLK
ncbi:MAG: hypothetical protein IKR11_06920, partial [Solobacterium sp.]|nr:hypothetical protein [Solobacterium sp.]